MKKRCRVCKAEYTIDDNSFSGKKIEEDERVIVAETEVNQSGIMIDNDRLRCCSQACYSKYSRFIRTRYESKNKIMHKSDWNPIP